MNVLVTAGNTLVPIDRVRCMTNVFTGRTGTRIAVHGYERGHGVTLLSSHPDVAAEFTDGRSLDPERWKLSPYRTFADLEALMRDELENLRPDALIHCAAVSDYESAGIFAPAPATRFREDGRWESTSADPPRLVGRGAAKVKSNEQELWLRLVPTPKLVDQVRGPWGFRGVLVKFKLEVGVADRTLLDIAEASRRHSEADLMVANTLEAADAWAYLGPVGGSYHRIDRPLLAERLFEEVERLHQERARG